MATKDICIDTDRGEIFVVAEGANQVDVYKLDDDGTPTAKTRSITNANLNAPSSVALDVLADEIYVANATDGKIIVFSRNADGAATALRVLTLL